MSNPVITYANDIHRDNPVVSLIFEKDYALIAKVNPLESIAWKVKAHGRASLIKSTTWSQSRGFWYIPKEDFKLNEVFEALKDVAFLDSSAIENETIKQREDKSNSSTKKNEPKYLAVRCNEKEKTFYLALPFALKEQFKKLEGAWWHPKSKQWSALDTEENREQLNEILLSAELRPIYNIDKIHPKKKINTPKLTNPV